MFAIVRALWRHSAARFLGAMALSVLVGVSNAICIGIINRVLGHVETSVWLFVAACTGFLTFGLALDRVLGSIALAFVKNLRIDMARRILASPLSSLEEAGAGPLFVTLTEDVVRIGEAARTVAPLLSGAAIVVIVLGYLAWIDWTALLVSFVLTIISATGSYIIAGAGHRALVKAREQKDRLFHLLTGAVYGTKELKLHSQKRNEFLMTDLANVAEAHQRQALIADVRYGAAARWLSLSLFIILGYLLYSSTFAGRSAAAKTSFVISLLYLKSALDNVLVVLPMFSDAQVLLAKHAALGLTTSEPQDVSATPASDGKANIQVEGVTREYRTDRGDERFHLGPITLNLAPGTITFLVGGNGSGKSTLVKVLAGLYTPESGRILVNGRVVDDQSRPSYREIVSAVFADYYLFESFAALDKSRDQARVDQHLVDLQLHTKVTIKDGRFSTTSLSSGQRKRLALLVSYLEDRPFCIFDEWAADQDPKFKQIFYFNILTDLKRRGKTVLVVSHDDAYFSVADQVIHLADGKQLDLQEPRH